VSTTEAISPRGQFIGEPHRPNKTHREILLYKHITGKVENPVNPASASGSAKNRELAAERRLGEEVVSSDCCKMQLIIRNIVQSKPIGHK
jgi:hypothetical protein